MAIWVSRSTAQLRNAGTTCGLTAREAAELSPALAAGEPNGLVIARRHRLTALGVHYQALADLLGVSTNTIMMRLSRCRRTLATGGNAATESGYSA